MSDYPGDEESLPISEAIFRAKITSSVSGTAGYRHGFVEQVLGPTGEYSTPETARFGTPQLGWLRLLSGLQADDGDIVWAAQAASQDGSPVYDGVSAGGGAAVADIKHGKLDGAMAYQGSATMSVWEYSGTAEADTSTDVTVYDWLLATGQNIAAGTQVVAGYEAATDRWYVVGAQCVGPGSGGMSGTIGG